MDLARERSGHGLWDLLDSDPRARESVRAHAHLAVSPWRRGDGEWAACVRQGSRDDIPSPMTLPRV